MVALVSMYNNLNLNCWRALVEKDRKEFPIWVFYMKWNVSCKHVFPSASSSCADWQCRERYEFSHSDKPAQFQYTHFVCTLWMNAGWMLYAARDKLNILSFCHSSSSTVRSQNHHYLLLLFISYIALQTDKTRRIKCSCLYKSNVGGLNFDIHFHCTALYS